jgi:uncharacterized protein (DUF1015 family)
MARIRAFPGLRPTPERAVDVAAPPYDVVNTEEARALADGRPLSFLRVSRPELEFPVGFDPYHPDVYARGAHNLCRMAEDGVLRRDPHPSLYLYRQRMGDHTQTGLVAAASVDDYLGDVIKKHEHTRKDKEDDRTRHVDVCNANTGPVFLTYRAQPAIDAIVADWSERAPVYDFANHQGVQHTFWVIDEPDVIAKLTALVGELPALYVADGHHRSASAARVGQLRRAANPNYTGDEPFNWFLAVLFPDAELRILDYNRVVFDLAGRSPEEFLAALAAAGVAVGAPTAAPYRPEERRRFGMYLAGQWYPLSIAPRPAEASDPVRGLDVSLLQEHVLAPLLGIGDPRTDKRIDFVGGIRGLGELERRVAALTHPPARYAVAFAMYPTTVAELMAIADAGAVMPPKSTWFEPKLMSGLVLHELA